MFFLHTGLSKLMRQKSIFPSSRLREVFKDPAEREREKQNKCVCVCCVQALGNRDGGRDAINREGDK